MNPSGSGTQGYNVYAYAGNNPVTLTDPSGHQAAEAIGPATSTLPAALAALYALGAAALSFLTTGPYRAQIWAFAAFTLLAVVLFCLGHVLCRTEQSAVTGGYQEAVAETVTETAKTWSTEAGWVVEWRNTETKREPKQEPEPEPQPTVPPFPFPDKTKTNDGPCSALNPPGRLVPPLYEGIAIGNEILDYGRAHIEREHSSVSNNEKGHFHEGVAESQASLEAIRNEALIRAAADRLYWSSSRENCKLEVPYLLIGMKTFPGSNRRRNANKLRIIARSTPPYDIITMIPI